MWKRLVGLAVLAMQIVSATCHAHIANPASRALLRGEGNKNGGNEVQPCGKTAWNSPGPVQATYSAGQVIDITIVISAQHIGRHQFRLCPGEPGIGGAGCTPLTNADDGTPYAWHTNFPQYPAGTYNWRFKLPDGMGCNPCVLWWHWMSANSCVPKGAPVVTCCGGQACSQEGGTVPAEEFWGCADIAVNGGGGGPNPNPVVINPPAPPLTWDQLPDINPQPSPPTWDQLPDINPQPSPVINPDPPVVVDSPPPPLPPPAPPPKKKNVLPQRILTTVFGALASFGSTLGALFMAGLPLLVATAIASVVAGMGATAAYFATGRAFEAYRNMPPSSVSDVVYEPVLVHQPTVAWRVRHRSPRRFPGQGRMVGTS